MGEFFKPLRRKFGVLTLGLACVFAVGWLRSYATSDAFVFHSHYDTSHRTTIVWLWSFNGHLTLNWDENAPDEFPNTEWRIYVCADDFWTFNNVGGRPAKITADWTWLWGGIAFGEFQSNAGARQSLHWVCASQYCFIVIPLTLLSAWLLLSRTRAPKPVPTVAENAQ